MKTLLAVLHLGLFSQVPVSGPEQTPVPTPPPENKQVRVIEFEDEPIQLEPAASEWDCFPDRRNGFRYRLVRVREDFDDKVMQSVDEM